MFKVKNIQKKININGTLLTDEPMALHTTFRTGGPADLFALPANLTDLEALLRFAAEEGLPWFITGGGANILVADRGIRGMVISTLQMKGFSLRGTEFSAYAGLDINTAAWETGAAGLAGLHAFYAMPGSLGGAVWMNARCYDRSISDILTAVTLIDRNGLLVRREVSPGEFDYKQSPFQKDRSVIVRTEFSLEPGDSRDLTARMRSYREDRTRKGHFQAPSAGSVFKNNRTFGMPSGQIIDRAGLKGFSLGGARVSPDHGNIIFNTGGASSSDIRNLIEFVKEKVYNQTGFLLEEEVLYIGEW